MKFFGCCVIIALLLLSCGTEEDHEQPANDLISTPSLSKSSPTSAPSEPIILRKPEAKTISSETVEPMELLSYEPRLSALPRQDLFPATAFATAAFPNSIINKNPLPIWTDPTVNGAVTSINRYFIVDFENDIFTNTDYYFTNGASLGLVHPALQHLFLSALLPNAGTSSLNHYGVALRQNMYTPINPEAPEIPALDRPFAGVLLVEFFKISTQHLRQLQLSSSFQIGLIGPPSLASLIQKSMHELEPVGWRYQIKSDLLINYSVQITQRVLRLRHLDWRTDAALRVGSYRSEAEAGTSLRIGILPVAFNPFPMAKEGSVELSNQQKKWLGWFELEAKGRYNVHDASLYGGWFNKSSPFTIAPNLRQHLTFGLSAGVGFAYKNIGLGVKIVYLSPEFKHGFDHRWGAIRVVHNF